MRYRVKVTEKHVDYVWVDASSEEEAKELAPHDAMCEFECLHDCEIVSIQGSSCADPKGE